MYIYLSLPSFLHTEETAGQKLCVERNGAVGELTRPTQMNQIGEARSQVRHMLIQRPMKDA